MPNLPIQLGGLPITTITQGMTWAALGMVVDGKPSLRMIVQAKDGEAATLLTKISRDSLDQLTKLSRESLGNEAMTTIIDKLELKAQGDRLTAEIDLGNAAQLAANPIERMREAARRSQCVNNLKQIGLAMHNYHSTYNTFPPAYNTSKDGKPLLSWRVHILPYLEHKALYDEFHLDEPWDSTHNKTLILRMPTTYTCNSASTKLAREGKTTYLTPRGPATIFPGATAIKFQDITDGTSNTILTIDAGNAAATFWTKPDDWDVTVGVLEPAKIFDHHPDGTDVGLADGSVRFLKNTITLKTLQALITRNGGEVVTSDDY